MKNKLNQPNELAYFKASESYSIAVSSDGKMEMKSRPMKYFAETLLANGWCQIHRSYFVNPAFVLQISENRDSIYMKNGKELPISRRYRNLVLKWRN
jgi:DNA-binding LytR/AlgR family response regulator